MNSQIHLLLPLSAGIKACTTTPSLIFYFRGRFSGGMGCLWQVRTALHSWSSCLTPVQGCESSRCPLSCRPCRSAVAGSPHSTCSSRVQASVVCVPLSHVRQTRVYFKRCLKLTELWLQLLGNPRPCDAHRPGSPSPSLLNSQAASGAHLSSLKRNRV